MFKYGTLLLSLLVFQFCGPSKTELAMNDMVECMTWATKQECEQKLGMPVTQDPRTGSFIFFHSGGYYYPYGNSYYYFGSHYPSVAQQTEATTRYGRNYSSAGLANATPQARIATVRTNLSASGPSAYSRYSQANASRGGFGSKASFYGGGRS